MKSRISLFLIALLAGLHVAAQPQFATDPRLAEVLQSNGFPKGVVLLAVEQGEGLALTTNDPLLAQLPTLPASTFKIPNSLIGLETGVITAETVFKWDGKPREVDAWEKDLSLPQAFQVSCVPCYQEVARKVGKDRMLDWVEQLGYGNMEIGGGIDKFWLTGKLAISPLQQVYFLRRLAQGQLAFSHAHMQTVRDMMLLGEQNGRRLYGKTGWASGKEHLGWFVGWVEGEGARVYFATRIHAVNPDDSFVSARRKITEAALTAFGYW